MTLRPLLLCADDFGLTEGIDAAVEQLVAQGHLNATSCLTNGPRWREAGPRAAALRPRALVGLHFNLTEGVPLSQALARHWPRLPSLHRCIALAHLRQLPMGAVAEEFDTQWSAFVQATGQLPDFVDGHQHVHHLPQVRRLIVERSAAAPKPLPVRSTAAVQGQGFGLKRALIERTGGRALVWHLQRARVSHNAVLLGAYDFQTPDYAGLMRGWLAQVPAEGALLFCHPAKAVPANEDEPVADAIAAARLREFAYLSSEAFSQDLQSGGVQLKAAWV